MTTQATQAQGAASPPSGWVETTLGEVAVLNYGKSLNTSKRIKGDIPVYGSSGITGWHNESLVETRGIIIGRKGTVGVIYKSSIPFFPIDTVYFLTQEDTKCDLDFLYNLLLNLGLEKMNADSAVPGLNRNDAYSRKILLPPLPEQRAIAGVLSAFDDKIELLREQNKTLEASAQAIFGEWFGKYSPDRPEDLPEGWRVGDLGQEFDIIMGQSPRGESYNEKGEGVIFFQGRAEFQERFPRKRLYTVEPKKIANKFDVLVSVRAPVGDINVAYEKCCIGRGLAAVKNESKSYALYKMKSLKKLFDNFEAEGTVFGSINKNSFSKIAAVIPSENIVKKFENIVKPLDQKIFSNSQQIQTLSAFRDTLLPRLMRGEVRVGF